MPSKRKQILQNIVTVLQGITVANGFNNDVQEVSRNFKDWTQTENFPRINVLPGLEQIKAEIHQQDDVTNFSDPLSFRLVSYVKTAEDIDDSGVLADAIEDLIEDIKKRLYTNVKLNLSFVEETAVDSVDAYFDWTENIGVIIIDCHVAFQWRGQTP